MKKELYIFRHGETDWNKENRTMGWSDVPLNDNGRAQAERLASDLQKAGLEIIYSSPLSRTFETAEIVARPNNIKIVTNDALKERNNGILEGHIARIEFPDIYDGMADPNFAPPGGESTNQLKNRVLDAMDNIIKTSEQNTIGISTSNAAARVILEKFIDMELPPFNLPNSAYFRLDWDGKTLKMNEVPKWLEVYMCRQ